MKNFIARLKKVSINDFMYLLLPPIVYRFIRANFLANRLYNSTREDNFILELQSLNEKKFSYFMDDSVIDGFCRTMRDQYVNLSSRPASLPENQKRLDDLEANGFTVVKGALNLVAINRLLERLAPDIEYAIENMRAQRAESGSNHVYRVSDLHRGALKIVLNVATGVIRIWNIETIDSALHEDIKNSGIFDICNSYLSGMASESKIYLDIKAFPEAFDSSSVLHADSPLKICKVFIALQDVGVKNAPFLYFKGSHKPSSFRFLKELLEYSGYNSKYYDFHNSYSNLGMYRLCEEYPDFGWEPVEVPLRRGDAIIADTHGVHGATNLIEGRRLQLGLVYDCRGFDAETIGENTRHLVLNSKQS